MTGTGLVGNSASLYLYFINILSHSIAGKAKQRFVLILLLMQYII